VAERIWHPTQLSSLRRMAASFSGSRRRKVRDRPLDTRLGDAAEVLERPIFAITSRVFWPRPLPITATATASRRRAFEASTALASLAVGYQLFVATTAEATISALK